MVLALKVRKEEAEKVRRWLADQGLLDNSRKAVKDGNYVYFPVVAEIPGFESVEKELPRVEKGSKVIDLLRGKIPNELIPFIPRSYDIIGHVAIVEVPEELKEYEKEIGEAILQIHKNVRTVAVEEGPHEGVFRVQRVRVVAGKNNLLTLYKEHGVKMWVDVGKVYFSVRHSFERKRIAELIKDGEVVACLFAGVGPYPLVIAKKKPRTWIYAVELNPRAYELMVENVKLNKFEERIVPIHGDVKDVVPRMFPEMADRVIMPLPKGAHEFLDEAFITLRPTGGVIHLYTFAPQEDPLEKKKKIERTAEKWGFEIKRFSWRKVADYAPRIWKVVYDVEVTKH